MYFVTLFLLFCVVKTINHRMKCHKPFYILLSTISPTTINPPTTPSISTANYSPLSSERGWGRGFVCLPSFNLHLSTPSPPQTNSKTTSSISTTNYSPLSSENHRSLFVKPAKRGKQRTGERLYFPQSILPTDIFR